MGPLAIALLLGIGWLAWSGRLQRLGRNDAMAGAVAILGAALAAHGRVFVGGAILAGAVGYLWLRPGSIFARRTPARPAAGGDPLVAARALLGVGADAGEADIRAAHRRLIGDAHPDRGGSAARSAEINDARDLLLAHLKARPRVHPS